MIVIETEYKCNTCNKSIIIPVEVFSYVDEQEARATASDLASRSVVLAEFSKKHSKHQLRQYSELEAIG